jgi:hypothetical protein
MLELFLDLVQERNLFLRCLRDESVPAVKGEVEYEHNKREHASIDTRPESAFAKQAASAMRERTVPMTAPGIPSGLLYGL